MITLCKEITFDSAHKLFNPSLSEDENTKVYGICYGGPEQVGHGHTYKLQCFLVGGVNSNGFIMNFKDLKQILHKCIIEKYDHKFLNDVIDVIPTCENQIQIMWDDILRELGVYNSTHEKCIRLHKLILWETPTSFVIKEV